MQSIYAPLSTHEVSSRHLKTLTFGVDKLDKVLGAVGAGDFMVLHGSRMCHNFSELLCVRSQLVDFEGEVNSSVVFIDGGNLFDPYLISESARLLGLDPRQALKNIWISRAFTGYQMISLVTERLQPFLEQKKVKLVVVSDIPTLFCDSNIGILEAKRLFNRLTRSLWKLVKEHDIILIVTTLSSRSVRKQCLEQYLLGRADIVVGVVSKNLQLEISVEKHPSMPLTSTTLFFGKPSDQSIMDNFLEV